MPGEPAIPSFEKTDIFAYSIEGKTRYLDPLRFSYRLEDAALGVGKTWLELENEYFEKPQGFPPDVDVDNLSSAEIAKVDPSYAVRIQKAAITLAEVIADALGVKVFDESTGEGCTIAMILKVYEAYVRWTNIEKKDIEDSPSMLPSSDIPPDTP